MSSNKGLLRPGSGPGNSAWFFWASGLAGFGHTHTIYVTAATGQRSLRFGSNLMDLESFKGEEVASIVSQDTDGPHRRRDAPLSLNLKGTHPPNTGLSSLEHHFNHEMNIYVFIFPPLSNGIMYPVIISPPPEFHPIQSKKPAKSKTLVRSSSPAPQHPST